MPKELRFHNGWKKWRLEVGETTHSFIDKSQARAAATWLQQCKHQLELESGKALQEELKVAGVPRKRNKEDLVKSILRLRYKAENRGCICCSGLQTSKAGLRKFEDSRTNSNRRKHTNTYIYIYMLVYAYIYKTKN